MPAPEVSTLNLEESVPDLGRWFSPDEVATRTGYGVRYVWRLCRNGRIPGAVKPEGTKYWRIPAWGLCEFLSPVAGQRSSSTPTPSLPQFEFKSNPVPKRKRF